mmetsp:Transcript_98909/g.317113  ORF Transcript_98909/g.317113 Transcript_98909/m.317113 type:complete len:241 (+) Transcript_98909:115-837(+)
MSSRVVLPLESILGDLSSSTSASAAATRRRWIGGHGDLPAWRGVRRHRHAPPLCGSSLRETGGGRSGGNWRLLFASHLLHIHDLAPGFRARPRAEGGWVLTHLPEQAFEAEERGRREELRGALAVRRELDVGQEARVQERPDPLLAHVGPADEDQFLATVAPILAPLLGPHPLVLLPRAGVADLELELVLLEGGPPPILRLHAQCPAGVRPLVHLQGVAVDPAEALRPQHRLEGGRAVAG